MRLTQEVIDKIQLAMTHTKMNGETNWKDGDESWCVEDMGESNPERYYYKDGKIGCDWTTPMEEEE